MYYYYKQPMQVTETSETPTPMQISREWGTYFIKATMSEDKLAETERFWPELSASEKIAYEENLSPDFETHIFLLPNPIWVKVDEVLDVLRFRTDNGEVRIYPPFEVSDKSETSGAFAEVLIPEGLEKVERSVPLPKSAVRGARMVHGTDKLLKWCRGIRVDTQSGVNSFGTLKLLLDHICQFTHQWWMRSPHNPMHGPLCMGGSTTKDFKIISELKYKGAGEVESTWHGICQYQPELGFGSPLAHGTWLLSCHHTQESRRADTGLLSFYDGMASYMAGSDDKAILNLCIATEIMLSKYSLKVLNQSPPKLERAIRKTNLVAQTTRETLANLNIDRNCVAHGREPFILGKRDGVTIEDYIRAVRDLTSAYLNSFPTGTWPEVMDARLEKRTRGS